jgi:hypothetical protein
MAAQNSDLAIAPIEVRTTVSPPAAPSRSRGATRANEASACSIADALPLPASRARRSSTSAAAFAVAITLAGHRAYIAADEHPLTYAKLFDALQADCGAGDESAPAMTALPSFRVRSDRLRVAGWRPAYPDVLACAADAVALAGSFDEAGAQ